MVRLGFLLLLTVILSGCAQQIKQPTLEDYGLVGVIAIDSGEKGKLMKVTVAVPEHAESAQKKIQTFSAYGDSPEEALLDITGKTELKISLAELRVIIFSEDFAKKQGLWKTLQGFYRDPIVGDNVYIAISKDSAEKMVKKEYPDKPDVIIFFRRLLQPRGETSYNPFTTIHDFIYYTTNEVADPHAPYLQVTEKTIEIAGVALFKKDKMVDKVTPPQAKLIEGILGKKGLPNMAFDIQEKGKKKESIVTNYVRTKSKVKTNGDVHNPVISIQLNLEASVLDYTGEIDLEDAKKRRIVEKAVSAKLKKETEELLAIVQKSRIDPFEFGEVFRTKMPGGKLSEEQWRDLFGKLKFNVNVKTTFVNYGTIR